MDNTNETAGTLLIGAIGIIVPTFIQNWATFILTIVSIIWVVYELITKIIDRRDNKRKTKT